MTILNPNTREAYQLLHDGALALTRCTTNYKYSIT